jgi:MFS family permease
VWGALGPIAGAIADRYGSGRVIAACGAIYALGLVGMSFAETPSAMHFSAGILVGGALSGATFATVLAVIGRNVAPEKRSTALGVATAAGSFGQFALLPVTQFLIGRSPPRSPAARLPRRRGSRSAPRCARRCASAGSICSSGATSCAASTSPC